MGTFHLLIGKSCGLDIRNSPKFADQNCHYFDTAGRKQVKSYKKCDESYDNYSLLRSQGRGLKM